MSQDIRDRGGYSCNPAGSHQNWHRRGTRLYKKPPSTQQGGRGKQKPKEMCMFLAAGHSELAASTVPDSSSIGEHFAADSAATSHITANRLLI